jgi:hypothetical protein
MGLDSDAAWIVALNDDQRGTVLVAPTYESWETNRARGSALSSDILAATSNFIRISPANKQGVFIYEEHSRKGMHSGTCEPIKPDE